jgi:8-amino-3,8-dideoxy-alpha-D-manno-octulosonate transaminase
MPGFEVIGPEERAEIDDVFNSGGILCRNGFEALRDNCFKVQDFEREFSKEIGVQFALAVTSGTAALRVALSVLDLKPGDEVITQCFTFVATVEAIIEARAVPVCCEVDQTLNLDPEDLINRITSKTRAVIVVHMLGTPARLRDITRICDEKEIPLIEDTAWGCGGSLAGKALGSWGRMSTFSFDYAKTITTGEGGMVCFRREEDFKWASAWHDHGHHNNPNLARWEDTRSASGFNFRMTELQGAVGLAQLRKLQMVVSHQRRNKQAIWDALKDIDALAERKMPEESYETADALIFFVADSTTASNCRDELLNIGLSTKILPEAYSWHFAGTWSHMKELVDSHGGDLSNAFPSSMHLLSRAVSLPVMAFMDDELPQRVRAAIEKALSE